MIVRDWAPQLEILAHASTGGFLSHCGWNSCMESLSMGVPIAAWPMHSDQPMNTMLVTQELKVGIAVREWANRDELVSSNVIESAVRKLMVSKDGQDMRRQAEELGIGVRQAVVSKDGNSRAALESFVAHISRS
ncbi:UDP-glucuronosyl/UDP-glucosyltransferase [Macleaya cordata]|uniref:UDP-glucuronosyl/UDP-glucosyltransferase n=1 Tax=Macleaya cordata TaxID=56857 RepID=A0A200QM97_MACCD|nr:UDP-glucuronosyl/UDP-glucosyltransferase [Macleaya cordata]